ncbi:MAG: hypothetical protein PHC28_12525 [Flavobacterium sp.]|uniref:hypothetical protein n=1 Tax=Flavobacterium sp. TaxID=239 RepID=UPI00260B1A80|nr:hypothetical protein [Flavobacterium sp.]MDD5151277.1 hypothetical protein [Flavobacterium sp.]
MKTHAVICVVWNNDNKHYQPIRLVTEWLDQLQEYVDEDCEYWDNAIPYTSDTIQRFLIKE